MDSFEQATLRLKQELRVSLDKEAAALLGLSPRAWAGRKKAGSFPEREVLRLAADRPEFGLDVSYVLTGQRLSGEERNETERLAAHLVKAGEPEQAVETYRNQARRTQSRAAMYQRIRDAMEYCDEHHLHLLAQTAASFGDASQYRPREPSKKS